MLNNIKVFTYNDYSKTNRHPQFKNGISRFPIIGGGLNNSKQY